MSCRAFRAPDNSVHFANFAPAVPSISCVAVPGAVAKQVVAAVTEIFIRRPNERVQYFTLDGVGTGIAASNLTGVFATFLRDTRFTLGPGVIDQVAILKGQRLFVSGFFVKHVQGFAKLP